MQHLVDLVKTANNATAMAEVVRAQSQALIAVVEHNNPTAQPAPLTLAPSNLNFYGGTVISGGMVLNERVGSISVTEWDEMSDDRLMELDRVLKNLIDTVMLANTGPILRAGTVRIQLATVGFVFQGLSEWLGRNKERDFAVARDTSLPHLVRMRAAASAWRPVQDDSQWWVDEMMRVVVRLMELRGM